MVINRPKTQGEKKSTWMSRGLQRLCSDLRRTLASSRGLEAFGYTFYIHSVLSVVIVPRKIKKISPPSAQLYRQRGRVCCAYPLCLYLVYLVNPVKTDFILFVSIRVNSLVQHLRSWCCGGQKLFTSSLLRGFYEARSVKL